MNPQTAKDKLLEIVKEYGYDSLEAFGHNHCEVRPCAVGILKKGDKYHSYNYHPLRKTFQYTHNVKPDNTAQSVLDSLGTLTRLTSILKDN